MQADDVNDVDIELRDLRLALVTSQHRSLRQAAEALNIRQSTLSRRLHEIERQLGVVLFERTNGGTRLTTVGLEFVASAKRILDDVDTELQRLRSRSRGELGLLAIGVHASPSAGNMHTTLVEYHRRFPDVDVRTVDGSHERLLCALAGNAVDVAIMTGVTGGAAPSELVLVGIAGPQPDVERLEDPEVVDLPGDARRDCSEIVGEARVDPAAEQ